MASGHIRKRKTKNGYSYQVAIETSAPDPVTGQRFRTYKTFKKKKDAENALHEMLRDMAHGCYAEAHNMSLSSLMIQWLDSIELSLKETTRNRYREQVSWYILPLLGKYPIESLNANIIQVWVNSIYQKPPTSKNNGKELSPKTVKNIFFNLKAALDYAVDLNLLAKNPCAKVNLPSMTKKEVEAYSVEEVQMILTQAQNTDLYFPIYLLLHTGMRKGELLGLRWVDVHIDDIPNPYIEITQTRLSSAGKEIISTPKSQSSKRKVFLSKQATQEFLDYRIWCRKILLKAGKHLNDTDLVIIKNDGSTDTPTNFTKRWNNFLKKNNIRKITVHGLRHTCATMLLQNNVDIKTISKRLGHADTTLVLNTYGHSLDSTAQQAAEKLDSIINIS